MENFATEQLKDPTLIKAWENAVRVDGELVNPDKTCTYLYFIVERDLLYRVAQRAKETIEQLVMPKTFMKLVLELSHGHILGGNFGAEKNRVLQRFY